MKNNELKTNEQLTKELAGEFKELIEWNEANKIAQSSFSKFLDSVDAETVKEVVSDECGCYQEFNMAKIMRDQAETTVLLQKSARILEIKMRHIVKLVEELVKLEESKEENNS